MIANPFPRKQAKIEEDYWISLSDLMTSLMMIFLLISVVYMIRVQEMVKIPTVYKETLQGLGLALNKEFSGDLERWHAVIDDDLTVRFTEPRLLFAVGSATLKPEFKEILNDFFPRYVRVMSDPKYRNKIEEIRIEGHTSTFWRDGTSDGEAYFHNMQLSQERTRSTLQYLMALPFVTQSENTYGWLKQNFRAIGFSSAKPVNRAGRPITNGNEEDSQSSQRVEFRVRTTVERQVADIVEKQNR